MPFGTSELIVIALVALVLFGGKRIADVGKGLGQGIKNFKQGLKDADDDDKPKPSASAEKKEEAAKEA